MNFADRIIAASINKKTNCVVGLDPRIDMMPRFINESVINNPSENNIISAIVDFHKIIIEIVKNHVVAIKPQIAFFEQYGTSGIIALEKTVEIAKENKLQVIIDAKRNDIGSTAKAYSNTYLGKTKIGTEFIKTFDVDAITINPYMGINTLLPFVEDCVNYDKGIFVLVKTSNKGSSDFQNLRLKNDTLVFEKIGLEINKIGESLVGNHGYSSVGAVVGATYPEESKTLRELMPNNIFLVPGYGAQGGTAEDTLECFDKKGHGAVISSTRGITYSFDNCNISENDFRNDVSDRILKMKESINKIN